MKPAAAPSAPVSAVDSAGSELRSGRPILLTDTNDAPGTGGSIVLPAALADPHWTAWAVRWTSGFLCAPLPDTIADALNLPLMAANTGTRSSAPAFTVSVDAALGTTTGISAADRARTARVLADPESVPADLIRPGHLVPIRVAETTEHPRTGRNEIAVDLCRLAGLPPVAVIGHLVADDGEILRPWSVTALGIEHGLTTLSTGDVSEHTLFHGNGTAARVTRGNSTLMRTAHTDFDATVFHDEVTGADHTVLRGPSTPTAPVVSVHLECHSGEVFGALTCFCGRRLQEALQQTARDGGLLIYLRRGRSSRLYSPHECTLADTGAVAAILSDLDVATIRLRGGGIDPTALASANVTVVQGPNREQEQS
ncbi:3,4-dihydroxy-2-butanone-4-phosphate synthase [Rhodococcus wratislaviensis]|uniref:3,4-dihydroxy-2-butanone-4-phosphate synthase n=1 Tax=Rhodococcus wratislaviensis TaxID=44752 RepID=UPI00365F3AB0